MLARHASPASMIHEPGLTRGDNPGRSIFLQVSSQHFQDLAPGDDGRLSLDRCRLRDPPWIDSSRSRTDQQLITPLARGRTERSNDRQGCGRPKGSTDPVLFARTRWWAWTGWSRCCDHHTIWMHMSSFAPITGGPCCMENLCSYFGKFPRLLQADRLMKGKR